MPVPTAAAGTFGRYVLSRIGTLPLETHDYGCLMAMVPSELSGVVLDWTKKAIDKKHLASEGLEDKPHVTILYGFTDPSPELAEKILSCVVPYGPFKIKLKSISLFEGVNQDDGSKADCLKADVDSQALHALNGILASHFDNKNKYPTYKPHLTLAYLSPKYSGLYKRLKPSFLGVEVWVTSLVYSTPDGQRFTASLVPANEKKGSKAMGEIPKRDRVLDSIDNQIRGLQSELDKRDHGQDVLASGGFDTRNPSDLDFGEYSNPTTNYPSSNDHPQVLRDHRQRLNEEREEYLRRKQEGQKSAYLSVSPFAGRSLVEPPSLPLRGEKATGPQLDVEEGHQARRERDADFPPGVLPRTPRSPGKGKAREAWRNYEPPFSEAHLIGSEAEERFYKYDEDQADEMERKLGGKALPLRGEKATGPEERVQSVRESVQRGEDRGVNPLPEKGKYGELYREYYGHVPVAPLDELRAAGGVDRFDNLQRRSETPDARQAREQYERDGSHSDKVRRQYEQEEGEGKSLHYTPEQRRAVREQYDWASGLRDQGVPREDSRQLITQAIEEQFRANYPEDHDRMRQRVAEREEQEIAESLKNEHKSPHEKGLKSLRQLYRKKGVEGQGMSKTMSAYNNNLGGALIPPPVRGPAIPLKRNKATSSDLEKENQSIDRAYREFPSIELGMTDHELLAYDDKLNRANREYNKQKQRVQSPFAGRKSITSAAVPPSPFAKGLDPSRSRPQQKAMEPEPMDLSNPNDMRTHLLDMQDRANERYLGEVDYDGDDLEGAIESISQSRRDQYARDQAKINQLDRESREDWDYEQRRREKEGKKGIKPNYDDPQGRERYFDERRQQIINHTSNAVFDPNVSEDQWHEIDRRNDLKLRSLDKQRERYAKRREQSQPPEEPQE